MIVKPISSPLETVRASGVRRGVFHCFSGDYEMARKMHRLGILYSIPGVVTFDKAKQFRMLQGAFLFLLYYWKRTLLILRLFLTAAKE